MHCHGNCWYVCLRYKWNISSDSWMFPTCQPRNQTLHDITEIHLFFFPLVKWPSGEIVTVSCTFLFWSSCHFLIQLIKGCVFCQGKYIDTSLLLTAEEGHKNFIKGSFCISSYCLAKNVCFRISLCIGLIPLISRRVLTWCLPYECELFNYPNVCLSAYVNKLLLKTRHVWIFGLVVYILFKKSMCNYVGKNSLIFNIAKCWLEQLTWGSGAEEFRLIFVNSLYMLLGAVPSPRYLRCEP